MELWIKVDFWIYYYLKKKRGELMDTGILDKQYWSQRKLFNWPRHRGNLVNGWFAIVVKY